MSRKIAFAVAVVLLVCLVAIGVTTAKGPQPEAPPSQPEFIAEVTGEVGQAARAKREEGKVGKKEAHVEKAKGERIDAKKLELDRKVAEKAGVLGAMGDSDLNRTLGSSGLSPELLGGIGGLIGTDGTQAGSGGLGGRGTGSEGLGGLGTKGMGLGGGDYGSGGGNFGSRQPGQTVYVSNDDSMSLASPQHVLYALQNHQRLRPSDIRPHELLNYFTFRTQQPEPGEVFDVLASAERDGDQLHVALAVHAAIPPRLPLDLTLLVDVSCSMGEDGKMARTQRALQLLRAQLRRGDHVDLVVFDNTAQVPFQGWIGAGYSPLDGAIEALKPVGATDLDLGLREAYRVARSHERTPLRNRRVLLITDANLNTGDVNPDTVTEIGRALDESGIRLTGVGVGRDFNDGVLDKLTEKGKGAYVFLGSDAVVDRLFGPAGFASLTQTVAHDVRYALKLPPSLTMEQFYGEEASTDPTEVQPVHFSAGTSQVLLQDLQVRDLVPTDSIELEISYRDPATGEEETRRFRSTVERMLAADPHNVRKARALMAWTDLLTDQARGADCTESLSTFRQRAAGVPDDREITFVEGLAPRECAGFASTWD